MNTEAAPAARPLRPGAGQGRASATQVRRIE